VLFAYYIDDFVEKISILKNNSIFATVIFILANISHCKIELEVVIFDKKERRIKLRFSKMVLLIMDVW
jgi:hypothetical protein